MLDLKWTLVGIGQCLGDEVTEAQWVFQSQAHNQANRDGNQNPEYLGTRQEGTGKTLNRTSVGAELASPGLLRCPSSGPELMSYKSI